MAKTTTQGKLNLNDPDLYRHDERAIEALALVRKAYKRKQKERNRARYLRRHRRDHA